jgi:Nif-specific regulatory protein
MVAPPAEPLEHRQLRVERDLYRRLLELSDREDVRPFLEDALGLVVEVTGAQRGYLELDRGRFWIARGFSGSEIEAVRRDLSTGIVAEALRTQKTISTASAFEDPRFEKQQSVQAGRIRAVLCAPVDAGTAVGVLYLQGREGAGPFPEEDRSRTEIFARHLAKLADRLLVRQEERRPKDHTAELRARLSLAGLAGTSRALAEVFRQVLVAAPVPIAVLITGESGTGKTAIARALHQSSQRAQGPFVELNCAALPEALFESELFGAEKGAHSTATQRLEGKIDAARRGTLFLDEVGEIPLALQGKLLTFLQSKRYYRLGGTAGIDADVRVVAATNRNLEEEVAGKRFREDLYYRLNVLEVRVPSLRERPEDVAPIADALVEGLGAREGRPIPLSRAAKCALGEVEWPGNVRQLENALCRGWATALSEGSPAIEPRHLFPERALAQRAAEPAMFQEATRRFQARLVRETLEASGWNVSEAARTLELSRSRLNELIRAHGLMRGPAGLR